MLEGNTEFSGDPKPVKQTYLAAPFLLTALLSVSCFVAIWFSPGST